LLFNQSQVSCYHHSQHQKESFNNSEPFKETFFGVRGEKRKKWALVAWEKIYKPKNHGGLGLDDLEVLSKALGEKLWWHWVKDPKAQWASIWKEKYARTWQINDHIRMSRSIKGSHI